MALFSKEFAFSIVQTAASQESRGAELAPIYART
uniref:SAM-dependent methyltransferase n=1 Tax=Ascaris lumbricoides TaxID=6252 RepID=A0A0M3HG41_ASCLU